MRLEDLEITGQQELFDRQDEAETRRVQREASNAFMAASQRPAPPRLSQSTTRRAQVQLAQATIAALGTDGYDAMAYSIGVAQ